MVTFQCQHYVNNVWNYHHDVDRDSCGLWSLNTTSTNIMHSGMVHLLATKIPQQRQRTYTNPDQTLICRFPAYMCHVHSIFFTNSMFYAFTLHQLYLMHTFQFWILLSIPVSFLLLIATTDKEFCRAAKTFGSQERIGY